jgi:hypothetical protein
MARLRPNSGLGNQRLGPRRPHRFQTDSEHPHLLAHEGALGGQLLGRPCLGVRFTVLSHARWRWLIEERQVVIFDVHEFEFGVGALFSDLLDPFSHGFAVATRACASEDDSDFYNLNVVKDLGPCFEMGQCRFPCFYSHDASLQISQVSVRRLVSHDRGYGDLRRKNWRAGFAGRMNWAAPFDVVGEPGTIVQLVKVRSNFCSRT